MIAAINYNGQAILLAGCMCECELLQLKVNVSEPDKSTVHAPVANIPCSLELIHLRTLIHMALQMLPAGNTIKGRSRAG